MGTIKCHFKFIVSRKVLQAKLRSCSGLEEFENSKSIVPIVNHELPLLPALSSRAVYLKDNSVQFSPTYHTLYAGVVLYMEVLDECTKIASSQLPLTVIFQLRRGVAGLVFTLTFEVLHLLAYRECLRL